MDKVPAPQERRLVYVQHGDYAEAVRRFAAGGKENYYAQRYTVDYVAGLAARLRSVTVLTTSTDYPLEMLPTGVAAQGIHVYPPNTPARHQELVTAVERLNPTDLVVAQPLRPLLGWALGRGIRTLPVFADSFRSRGLRNAIKKVLLRRLPNNPGFRWVANHNLAASLDLNRIGIRPEKILPYDWPPVVSPTGYAPKSAPPRGPFRLLYVGMLIESKGIGDVLRAMPRLPECTLTVVGAGEGEAALRALPATVSAGNRVWFRGKVPHEDVLKEMRGHDVVLVPSRHEYPEGLPMTIYEALCTRTPLAVSDHPMFMKRIVPDRNAVVFKEKDPVALASAVERLRTSPELYQELSQASGPAAETFLCPLKWHVLLDLWLEGGPDADAKLGCFSLRTLTYG
jgi:glycosyltransferase involved in cell wall biosynthesis